MTLPVLIADECEPQPAELSEADLVYVRGAEAHHAKVRRLGVGEQVDLVDGQGWRATGEIENLNRDQVVVRIHRIIREVEPCPHLILVQALAKGGRDESAIAAATEVGVDEVYPWQANRCVVQWRGDKAQKSLRRWEKTIRESTKQSRRARLPRVHPVVDTGQLAEQIARLNPRENLVLVLHETATTGILSALTDGDSPRPHGQVWVIVGPEGGIDEAELDSLRQAGGHPVRLGPTVLRSSTAGPVALGVLAAHLGRWSWAEESAQSIPSPQGGLD